uniref:Uncharacterized protein n=1 Tax=Cannabis sativa TaxID=3483 RepID=A0A803PQC8_CANSA
MSQRMVSALKKRVGDSSGLSPPAKKSRGSEIPSKEKAPVDEIINLSEERPIMDLPVQKVSMSKSSRVSDQMSEVDNELSLELFLGEVLKEATREELAREVESLETGALEVFYDFWKANPEGNFDYLGDSKSMYIDFCATRMANKNPEATTSTASADQSTEIPIAQNVEPPTPSEKNDPYQEPRTPAV